MHKLPYFPNPLPDELFYSICARYHDDSPNSSCQQSMKDLYGIINVSAMVEFPSRLNAIILRLSPRTTLSAEKFINDNTLLPLFLPFLPTVRANKAIHQMKDPDMQLSVSLVIGQSSRNIPLIQRLRYCSQCIEEDRLAFGEEYWHRSHQLAGIHLCHKHEEWLWESSVTVGPNAPKHSFMSLGKRPDKSGSRLFGNQHDLDHHRWLAKSVHSILNYHKSRQAPDLSLLRQQYRSELNKRRYLSSAGEIFCKRLLGDFRDFYRAEFLKDIDCSLIGDNQNWLFSLFRKTSTTLHPLHHLLAMRFLSIPLVTVLSVERQNAHPFGHGPWPCLNRASAHFGADVISTCNIVKDEVTQTVTGTFPCSCGFTYSRKGPECDHEERMRYSSIISTGNNWDQKLLNMLSSGNSILKTAQTLDITRYEVYKNLGRLITQKCGVQVFDDFLNKKNRQRIAWLALLKANPGRSRTELAKMNKGLYWWLNSCDSDWHLANSPCQSSKLHRGRPKDWASVDRDLSSKVQDAAQNLIAQSSQVTLTSISKNLGATSLIYSHRHKLPETMAAISKYSESDEDYAIRRIDRVVAEMRQRNESVSRWQILLRAGISPQMAQRIELHLNKIISDNSDPVFEFAYDR